MSFSDRLKANNAAWKESRPMVSAFDLPPDGDYQAIVDRFDFIQSKKNERYYLKTELKIMGGGEWDGHMVSTLHDMEDPERFDFLKTHLTRMGMDPIPDELDNLPSALNGLLDTPVEVTVKTSNDINPKTSQPYRNLYVNKALGPPLRQRSDVPTPEPAGAAATKADDDIPF